MAEKTTDKVTTTPAKKWFVFRSQYGSYSGTAYSTKAGALAAAAKKMTNGATVYVAEVIGRVKFTAELVEVK